MIVFIYTLIKIIISFEIVFIVKINRTCFLYEEHFLLETFFFKIQFYLLPLKITKIVYSKIFKFLFINFVFFN